MNNKIDMYLLGISIPIFLFLDFVFLFLNKENFERQIIQVQRVSIQMNPFGILFCYLFLVIGLYYFIFRDRKTPMEAFLLGLVIYGVYETTSYALLKKWRWNIVLMDTLWGGVLFALTTFITYKVV